MGDAAEMLLDGTCCECCGEVIEDMLEEGAVAPGFPRYCSTRCAIDRGLLVAKDGSLRMRCPICEKILKPIGLAQHLKDKHGGSGLQVANPVR